MATLKIFGGGHIRNAIAEAVALAIKSGEVVTFDFNGKTYTVNPDDSYESARARAETLAGFPILTADEESARASAEIERTERESAAAIAAAGVPTESEMRAADVPWLKTPEELQAYIKALVERPHDYGTCVYAMSLAATAAFHYVAVVLGVTGFQASCADLDILRRTRRMKGPFLIIKAEDALYPQYDLRATLDEALTSWQPWLETEAAKLIKERGDVHPAVSAHWQMLTTKKGD